MPASRPNPYRDPLPFNRVRIGGRLIKALLYEFDGLKIEDGWKVDKSKSSSGGAAKFTGTKLLEAIKLTFKCVGIGNALSAAEAAFDDLIDVYALLQPVPGQGGGTTATAAAGQTKAVGSPPADGTPSQFTAAESSFGAAADKKAADPDPGPRPPTLPIEFAPCAMLGVFAVARKSFEIKYDRDENAWSFILEVIQDKPPTPAGGGVMAAPKPAAPAAGNPAAAAANEVAAAEAAGT